MEEERPEQRIDGVENSEVESGLLKALASHTLLRCAVRQRVGQGEAGARKGSGH